MRSREIHFPRRPLIMGIVNINDDSFSGDGRVDVDWAIEYSRQQVADGADIVDIGAESARTNRDAISEEEEKRRLIPFVKRFQEVWKDSAPCDAQQIWPPLLSVNTWRSPVARAVLAEGGDILNDMSGLPTEENARICAETRAALLIMHTMGQPKVPHTHVQYGNVMEDILQFFKSKMELAKGAGISPRQIILDPGLDFAKQGEDNLRIIRELEKLHSLNRPILLPLSRKSFIGKTQGIENPLDRDAATVACLVIGQLRGAAIFRMHNVKAARQALATLEMVESSS
ncbi:MAG: dihydropteroate synthase [Chthoniobacterales bacterium]